MEGNDHECSQALTLNTICLKLDGIQKDITKIQEFQETYSLQIEQIRLNSAKYPSPESVGTAMDKIKVHDTYFAIGGAGLVAAWGFLLWIADKIWK
jgi:hypothetical protein